MLRFLTAGESHGPCLTTIVEGVPAGFTIDRAAIDADLRRRQGGHGRGARMRLEQDRVEVLAGVRFGRSLGSPIALRIENRDFGNWRQQMSADAADRDAVRPVTRPRPGHADLPGALKYGHDDVRDVLERASARETAARSAVGSLAKQLLAPFGVRVHGLVVDVGGVAATPSHPWLAGETPSDDERAAASFAELIACAEASPVRVADAAVGERIVAAIDAARAAGDTLGGVVAVVATGLPPGLGSHVHQDRKLDGRLAQALLSVQAAKGVEIGQAFDVARRPGSRAHDEIAWDARAQRFRRPTNRAGGLEGGMTNGEPLLVRVAFKPLSTLMRPLRSVDLVTREEATGAIERSDVCAVPAAAVVCECVVAFELARALLEKCGGDSFAEVSRNLEGYLRQIGYA